MQRILYQIQAYISRLVLLVIKKFWKIIYLVVRTDNLLILTFF